MTQERHDSPLPEITLGSLAFAVSTAVKNPRAVNPLTNSFEQLNKLRAVPGFAVIIRNGELNICAFTNLYPDNNARSDTMGRVRNVVDELQAALQQEGTTLSVDASFLNLRTAAEIQRAFPHIRRHWMSDPQISYFAVVGTDQSAL